MSTHGFKTETFTATSFTTAKTQKYLKWITSHGMWCQVTSVVSVALRSYGQQPARVLCPRDSPGKNTGVGCHALLQGIFPTQGLNLGLLHCKQILYHLSQHLREVVCWVPKVNGDVSFPKKMQWRTQAYGGLFLQSRGCAHRGGCRVLREERGSAARSATAPASMQVAWTGMKTGHDRRRAAFTSCV